MKDNDNKHNTSPRASSTMPYFSISCFGYEIIKTITKGTLTISYDIYSQNDFKSKFSGH